MHLTVDHSDFKRALTIAGKAIGKAGSLPALSGVRLEAAGEHLHLAASDLDVTVTQRIGAVVHAPGTVLVPAKPLAGAIKKGKGNVELRLDGGALAVLNGTTTRLRPLPLDEFPPRPAAGDGPSCELDLAAIAEVLPAASKDEARPILTAVRFAGRDAVATDSYRLHLVRGEAEYPEAGVLVPARLLRQVLAAKPSAPVSMQVVDGNVAITSGSTVWIARSIDGEYPDCSALIPKAYPYVIELDRAGFISLVSAVAPLGRGVVRLHFEAGRLTASTVSPDVGESTGSMDAARCDLPDGGVSPHFNAGQILDAAKAGRGDVLTVALADELKPALISDERGPAVTIRLLMPVRPEARR